MIHDNLNDYIPQYFYPIYKKNEAHTTPSLTSRLFPHSSACYFHLFLFSFLSHNVKWLLAIEITYLTYEISHSWIHWNNVCIDKMLIWLQLNFLSFPMTYLFVSRVNVWCDYLFKFNTIELLNHGKGIPFIQNPNG